MRGIGWGWNYSLPDFMKKVLNKEIAVYQTESGALELRGDFENQNIWATQAHIAEIFRIDRSVVSKHIANIVRSGEVDEKSNVQKMHVAFSDRPVAFYSLDIILAVGYRTNSGRAILFRKWATSVLREHLVEGFTINRSRVAQNYHAFLKAVSDVKALLPVGGNVDAQSVLELVRFFAGTWISLDAFDRASFPLSGLSEEKVQLTANEVVDSLGEFKKELANRGEVSELFGRERQKGCVAGIVGNVLQSANGKDLYEGVELKAAQLLYFMVKDHPFVDGNKRCGAFAFLRFLKKAGRLDVLRLTPDALTALTLLIAESHPKEKERITGLVAMMVRGA